LSRFNEESDEDELSIQAEDHYADLGDGLVLETEEKSSSAYRYSVLLWPVFLFFSQWGQFPSCPHYVEPTGNQASLLAGSLTSVRIYLIARKASPIDLFMPRSCVYNVTPSVEVCSASFTLQVRILRLW
jgi:hypothetical protein